MVVAAAVLVLAVVVVLLMRGRRRGAADGTPEGETPWDSLDRGEDPTEPA